MMDAWTWTIFQLMTQTVVMAEDKNKQNLFDGPHLGV